MHNTPLTATERQLLKYLSDRYNSFLLDDGTVVVMSYKILGYYGSGLVEGLRNRGYMTPHGTAITAAGHDAVAEIP